MVLSLTPCATESFEQIDTDEILPEIKDIDNNSPTDFDVPEYAHDIHNYLKKAEVIFNLYYSIYSSFKLKMHNYSQILASHWVLKMRNYAVKKWYLLKI